MNVQRKEKGFTIIEVVLVLAIAGLIFLMVFIALPALQRSQRDTQRRDDVSRFISQLQSYATNNRGDVPSFAEARGDFLDSYMKQSEGEFKDPRSGEDYVLTTATPTTPDDGTATRIQYRTNYKCDGENITSAGDRSVAVRIQLEGSGIFCQDNQ